ncbi:MAG TPA: C69 family dipeptidase, partial [bacterium]|nr:C69 family dipeptidase [bacterium]
NLSADFVRGVPGAKPYPLWIKPDAKISTRDVFTLMRDHYENTPYYWIDCGNTKTTGQVVVASLFTRPRERKRVHLKNIFELYPDYEKADRDDDTPSCSLAEAIGKQDLYINTMMAAYAGDLLWKLIRQAMLDCQGVFVNLDTLQTRPIPLKQPKKRIRRKRT